ncbi:MAG TPA: diguanylate cyclase [Anaeromyxobacteraceae bacterium]|nr:diguanylate cyclase [Anaeromyxobacteraceae bacterium]
MAPSVLLVDDERFARTLYSDYLRAGGHDVEVADSSESALVLLACRRFDVLVTDVILPGAKDGLELLDAAKHLDPNIGVVVITALDEVAPAVRAIRSGATDYLVKPVTPEALQLAVQRCLATRELLAENLALRAHIRLFESCQRIAVTLDRSHLVPLALEAMAAECGAGGAALLERTAGGRWSCSGAHGLPPDDAARLAEAAEPALAALDAASVTPLELPAEAGGGRALLIPIADESLLAAALVPVSADPPAERLGRALVVARHAGLALRNLGRLEEVRDLAYVDDLTRLFNTRYLDLTLDREVAGGKPFTVLFLDLDHFKLVNDEHGHLSGSQLLVEVGRVLRSCVRDEDVIARFGGDEYVVVLVGIDAGGGLKVAERIRRAIEDHRFLSREGGRVRITASIGLASHPEHASEKAELVDLADRAMYRGKRTTRNVVYVASRDLPPVPPGERG